MSGQELLDEMAQLADDFMVLATERDGVISGLAAECSQRLDEVHSEFTRRFENAGEIE